jgi:hypothetical protein
MSRDRIAASSKHARPSVEDDRLGFRLTACGDDPLTSTEGCPDCAGSGVNITAVNPAVGCVFCDGTGWRP